MENSNLLKSQILLSVYNIETAQGKIHNKIQFMNISHLMKNLTEFSDAQLSLIKERLSVVENLVTENINQLYKDLEEPVMEVIKSYDSKSVSASEN